MPPVIDSAPLIEGYPPNDCCHGATLLSSANKLCRFVKGRVDEGSSVAENDSRTVLLGLVSITGSLSL